MNKRHERAWMAAALAAGSIALGGAVQAQGALPAVQQQGSVHLLPAASAWTSPRP